MPDPLSKIGTLISSLEELRLHMSKADLAIGNARVNAQLHFSVANACLRNKAVLLYGGMGANKTTLVNLLGASFMGLPFDDVESLMVSGHPEQTEEKILGFIDPRQWSRGGTEAIEVLWTPWARSSWKVINEINRFPSGKQNLFLEILQKRKIGYAGKVLTPGDTCYFATMNPDFSSTYPLDEALLDRISACVPATQPDFIGSLSLGERERPVYELADELPRFTSEEFNYLPEMAARVELDPQTELAIISLLRDFTLCERSPGYDKTQLSGTRPSRGLCNGCHYFNNPEVCCWQVDEGLSDRVRQDMRDYSRAMALLLGRKSAGIDILRAVAPYIIWHRVTANRSLLERPPYYGARKLDFVSDLAEKSINRTLNERGEMNMVFSQAVDGDLSGKEALRRLSEYDDPIARLDYVPALERMVRS
ncbi:MAG TPA: AAA family ATPase [Methanotrichaceae archaeon]|nr:AAA family ATPase [Methanotrichaceae archaeon]